MIDPAMFQQLMAQRQAQMPQQGGPAAGPPGGQMNPDIMQRIMAMRQAGGGAPGMGQMSPQGMQGNPYMQMLMQRGMGQGGMGMRLPAGMMGPQAQSPSPQGGGWPERQMDQARPMPPQQGQGPQGAPGVPSPQQGGQGGGSPYQRMFQGGGQGGGGPQQSQMTPTGLPRLQSMGMPTGDANRQY